MTDLRAERPSSSDYTEFMRPGTRVPRINCTTEKAGFMCEAKELIYNISLFLPFSGKRAAARHREPTKPDFSSVLRTVEKKSLCKVTQNL